MKPSELNAERPSHVNDSPNPKAQRRVNIQDLKRRSQPPCVVNSGQEYETYDSALLCMGCSWMCFASCSACNECDLKGANFVPGRTNSLISSSHTDGKMYHLNNLISAVLSLEMSGNGKIFTTGLSNTIMLK